MHGTTITLCLLALALSGCATTKPAPTRMLAVPAAGARVVAPRDAAEAAVLQELPSLAPESVPMRAGQAQAGAVYLAASGRTCRSLTLAGAAKVACRDDERWFFVPNPMADVVAPSEPAEANTVGDAESAPSQSQPAEGQQGATP